jgi:hypothetical protein
LRREHRPVRRDLAAAIEAALAWPELFRARISHAIEHNGWAEQHFAAPWNDFRRQVFGRTKNRVTHAYWNIPVGTYWNDEGLFQLHVRLDADTWIYRFASAEQREFLKTNYADRHAKEQAGFNKLRSVPTARADSAIPGHQPVSEPPHPHGPVRNRNRRSPGGFSSLAGRRSCLLPYFGGTPIFGAHRLPTPMLCNEREKIMIRLFGILALVAGVAGCVAAQQPYDAYGGPGYPPRISIGIGIGGGFNW